MILNEIKSIQAEEAPEKSIYTPSNGIVGITPTALEILHWLFDTAGEYTIDEISTHFSQPASVSLFYIESLSSLDLVTSKIGRRMRHARVSVRVTLYLIASKGRSKIMELKGL